jgi:hypothetical protein
LEYSKSQGRPFAFVNAFRLTSGHLTGHVFGYWETDSKIASGGAALTLTPGAFIIMPLNMVNLPLRKKRNRRSFKVIKALNKKWSDHTSKLAESRLEIDAERKRVVQAGCRADSALYWQLKATAPRSATLPFKAYVLLAETTRGSKHKEYAYQVSLHALPENLKPQDMQFQGSYRTRATKLTIEDFKALSPKANQRKSKAMTTPKALYKPSKRGSGRRRQAAPITDDYDSSSSGY